MLLGMRGGTSSSLEARAEETSPRPGEVALRGRQAASEELRRLLALRARSQARSSWSRSSRDLRRATKQGENTAQGTVEARPTPESPPAPLRAPADGAHRPRSDVSRRTMRAPSIIGRSGQVLTQQDPRQFSRIERQGCGRNPSGVHSERDQHRNQARNTPVPSPNASSLAPIASATAKCKFANGACRPSTNPRGNPCPPPNNNSGR